MKSKINILGTEYTINTVKREDDPKLSGFDGYCDVTTKEIVLCQVEQDKDSVKDLDRYMNGVLRHEIVHAFLFESGLHAESFAMDETCVDWIALQASKMFNLWAGLGIL